MIVVSCDGSITGSHWAPKGQKDTPAHGWIGWVARTESGVWVHHHSADLGIGGTQTGNVSEHMSVNSALRWLSANRPGETLEIQTDSQIIVGHLSGTYNIHNALLAKIAASTKSLEGVFRSVKYKWIRRESNREADALSKSLQPKFFHIFGGKIPEEELTAEFLAKWK